MLDAMITTTTAHKIVISLARRRNLCTAAYMRLLLRFSLELLAVAAAVA